jgi:hypothetical protein
MKHILQHHPYLEMDAQASKARKSLILGQDFWGEKTEEDHRQQAMQAICIFAVQHGETIRTQREKNRLTMVYNTRIEAIA